jgi:CubicO group peptidase (beta-lactamase class C family)
MGFAWSNALAQRAHINKDASELLGSQANIERLLDQRIAAFRAKAASPSLSIAVVQNGRLTYAKAFGKADLAANRPADADTVYPIGSVTKQFVSAAILMLQAEGTLSIEDYVDRYLPNFPHGKEVRIRQLLTHTSGYGDYAWVDYYLQPWGRPDPIMQILEGVAQSPLAFRPGTVWEYSNTNYSIAAVIAEKVAGVPLHRFLAQRIFGPLGMASAGLCRVDTPHRATGYFRPALGSARPSPPETFGAEGSASWGFGAYDLCMTPSDLARWNVGLMQERVLSAQSYRRLTTEEHLANGEGTEYGLGVDIGSFHGVREISHEGATIGGGCDNRTLPSAVGSVTICDNLGNNSGHGGESVEELAMRLIAPPAFKASDQEIQSITQLIAALRNGRAVAGLLTPDAQSYFDNAILRVYRETLRSLGALLVLTPVAQRSRGTVMRHVYRAEFETASVQLNVFITSDGLFQQFMIFEE